jgi:hypothetical protein
LLVPLALNDGFREQPRELDIWMGSAKDVKEPHRRNRSVFERQAAGGKRVDLQLGTGFVDRNELGQPFAKPFGGQARTDPQVNASLFPEPMDQTVHEVGARRRNIPGCLGAKRVNDLNRGEIVGSFGRLVEAVGSRVPCCRFSSSLRKRWTAAKINSSGSSRSFQPGFFIVETSTE